MTANPHSAPLRALAAELRALAARPPAEAMVALGPLLDGAGADSVVERLRHARTLAAQRALDGVEGHYPGKDYGRKAQLARLTGLSEGTVGRILAGEPSPGSRARPARGTT